MSVRRKLWGRTESGEAIYKYIITNESGASVELCNLGATIVSVIVPDKNGKLGDVCLGYRKAESYINDGPYFGKTPGRFSNRIGKGKFELNGKTYTLPLNDGNNHLHGGPEGFSNKIWASRKSKGGVEFMYLSPDGEQGYPGNLRTVVRYDWSENNELRVVYTAKTDADTIVNLTNHAYWNLNGKGNILRHYLRLNCSDYLPTDAELIPTGAPETVAGTPMDFLTAKTIGRDIRKDFPALNFGGGYDACYCIDGWMPGQISEACELYSKVSGRVMKIFTTQPAIQVYTGNFLAPCPVGKKGRIYHNNDGVALECQYYPDAPNHADYPSAVVKAGKSYKEAIIYQFSVQE